MHRHINSAKKQFLKKFQFKALTSSNTSTYLPNFYVLIVHIASKDKIYNNFYTKSLKFSSNLSLLRIHVISWIVSRYPDAPSHLRDTVIAGKFHRKSRGFRSPHETRSRGYEIVKPHNTIQPILKQLFAVFTARCGSDVTGCAHACVPRGANWQSARARASSLSREPMFKQTSTHASEKERERGEMKGEQFSRNRKRLARARARPEMKNFLYRKLLSSL